MFRTAKYGDPGPENHAASTSTRAAERRNSRTPPTKKPTASRT